MILAAEQYGFLHAHPETQHPDGSTETDRLNRMDQMIQNKQEPPLVRLEWGAYLLRALWDAGAAQPGFNGVVPLGWQDALAYCQVTRRLSQPWEAEALVRMSRAYVQGLAVGKKRFGIAPIDRG